MSIFSPAELKPLAFLRSDHLVSTGTVTGGWTMFTPSPNGTGGTQGTKLVYVDQTLGNDNTGTGTIALPYQTISKGYSMLRDGYPDWMLLKCGETWAEDFPAWTKSGRGVSEPMLVCSYGTGNRPRIRGPASSPAEAILNIVNATTTPVRYLAFTNLDIKPSTYNGTGVIRNNVQIAANVTDVLLEGNLLAEATVNFTCHLGASGSGVFRPARISLRRNVIVDAYLNATEPHTHGAFFDGTDTILLEENLFDHNGWNEANAGADRTDKRHNCYIQGHPPMGTVDNCTGVITRRNIFARACANGLQQRQGGLSDGNVFLANPFNHNMGTAEEQGVVRNCVFLDSVDIPNVRVLGVGVQTSGPLTCEVYGNIFAQRSVTATLNLYAISLFESARTIVHDNIVYKWFYAGATEASCLRIEDGTVLYDVYNNYFQQPTGGRMIWSATGVLPASAYLNKYYSGQTTPFYQGGNALTFSGWSALAGEAGSTNTFVSFASPDRTIPTYMTSLGETATLAAFLTAARAQSQANWQDKYTAQAVRAYMQAGFSV